MMKPWISILIPLSLLLSGPPALAQKTVSLATTPWEPYVGQDLQNLGFASEIITEAFKRMGYRVEFAFMPPRRVMKEVAAGTYHAGYPAYYSEERAERFYYSDPFAQSEVGFFKRKDRDIGYETLGDLKPYKIGVCLGFAYPPEFNGAGYLKKEVAANEVLNLKKLMGKRIDLFISDRAAAQAVLNGALPEGKDVLKFMDPPLEVRNLHLIFGKHQGNEFLVKDFNAGLRKIMEDGTVDRILSQHGVGH
ncbi:MAG: transporter substrate-binding domain-containing protein [Deltaproteobacteria bacterium]|nr:transporter substrate-binding domain-containing protein [Deltaproteobacteria bacterium]